MDAADPLCAVSSATSLLRRTFGGPAPAASPSKADEVLLGGISGPLKGSKDLIEQAKIAMKEYGDIRMVYQDDGGKDAAAANCKNNLLGRRPAGERKRYRFAMRPPASKPLPVVDRTVLDMISDPDEYFAMEDRLDKAEAEIKRLSGVVEPKITLNFVPVVERKRRTSQPRKSYFFSSGAHTTNANTMPASQSRNMTESQTSQDDTRASVSEKNEQSVPSRSNNRAISDGLVEEDSFAEKDTGHEITDIMAAFQNFDGPDKLDFLRKTIGIGEIGMEKNYGRDSILGDMPLRSTARIKPQEVHTLERPLPGSHRARVSELAERIFGDAAMDKHNNLLKDDEPEGHTLERPLSGGHQARVSDLAKCVFGDPAMDKHNNLLKDYELEDHTLERSLPMTHQARVSKLAERVFGDTAMDKHTYLFKEDEFDTSDTLIGEQSLAHNSSDVVFMTDETFSTRRKYMEASSLSANSAERVLDPERNMPDCATIDDDSRHNISTEEDSVPMDYRATDKFNNEVVISSHHSEDASTEMLADTPGTNVAPDDIARTSHSSENNIQHQEVVEEVGVVQDTSFYSLEIPLEDIGPQNQSQALDETTKGLIEDLRNALSPTKEKTTKAARRGKTGQRPKRGKKAADESCHSLEIPQEDFDSENQPTHHVNTEGLIEGLRNVLSSTKEKTQKVAQRGKTRQQPKRGKKVADESLHSVEIPQQDFDSENQPTHHVNTEGLISDLRNTLSPTKQKMQKAAERGKTKEQLKRGGKVADESSHSLEIPQADSNSENQPHTHDVNTEQQTVVMRNVLSPNKPKGQKEAQRRSRLQKLNKRKSLADAGLEWQSGVRRSTRVRHRPLEHWRGERFVYGRIHDTMVTVIGVKSYSPDGSQRALKVKSFVPDEYSDIVAQGAKY